MIYKEEVCLANSMIYEEWHPHCFESNDIPALVISGTSNPSGVLLKCGTFGRQFRLCQLDVLKIVTMYKWEKRNQHPVLSLSFSLSFPPSL